MDYQRFIDAVDDKIVNRPGTVVAVFLVVTAVFAVGLGNVSTEAGTEQFAEEVPEQEALDAINQEFEPPFGTDTGSTQLIQTGENVVSKKGILRMLRAQHRMEQREGLRVESSRSAARIVAQTLNPNATTLDEQIRTVERATDGEVERAVKRANARNPSFALLLSKDFNPKSATASSTVGVVEHAIPANLDDTAQGGGGAPSPMRTIQLQTQTVVDSVGGDIRVFGSGIIDAELSNVIADTLLIVIPAAVLLIVLFLIVAYRDPVDLILGVIALAMAIVWTMGFLGLAGIAFNQILIAVPPLLLAVGIDFGIHAINRYREERTEGMAVGPAMRRTTDQLLVAFFIVTTTTVIGFSSNLSSDLLPIRDFGVVASIGIVFTFLIFGIFLPALKVYVDYLRERYPVPTVSQKPLGSRGSFLGRLLQVGVEIAARAPIVFLAIALLASAGAGVYASDVDTTFTQEQFLPPEETPEYLADLPEPFRPNEYTVTRDINFLEDNFDTAEGQQAVVYVDGPMEQDFALEALHRAGDNPPSTFLREDGHAVEESIVTVIRSQAERDESFRRLVERNDRNRNGIPDDNLDQVYDALLSSPAREAALEHITENRRSARVVYSVEGDADQSVVTAEARDVADRFRYQGTATGQIIVFQAIADLIFESALVSLALALAGTSVFLVFIYYVVEGRPSLGVANLVPIVVTVAFVAGTMRLLGISFNAFTATVLAITIGLGIDYSVHVVHRFADEVKEQGDVLPALERTVVGTGGALLGSVLTTAFGIGVLTLSIFPAIGQFGILTAISVLYSFLASIVVLPSALVIWDRVANRDRALGATPGVDAASAPGDQD